LVLNVNLVLKLAYLHYSMVLEHIVILMMDPSLDLVLLFCSLLNLKFWILLRPSLMLLPIKYLLLLRRYLWSWTKLRRYGFLLLSLMLMLLHPPQFYYLLRINIAFHCSILLSSMPLLQNLFLFIIIKLRHQNYFFGCFSLGLFPFFRRDVCRVQMSFVFYKPLPQILFSFHVFLWLFTTRNHVHGD